MKESKFQSNLIKKIKNRFEGAMVMKTDPSYIQGVPDLLVLYKNRWAALECKQDSKSKKRPNQEYYVEKMNEMSFSKFIHKENEKEILDELERSFQD